MMAVVTGEVSVSVVAVEVVVMSEVVVMLEVILEVVEVVEVVEVEAAATGRCSVEATPGSVYNRIWRQMAGSR